MAEGLRYRAYQRLGDGLNLDANRLTVRSGESLVAQNCDRDHTYSIRKRSGNVKLWTFRTVGSDGKLRRRPVAGFYNHEWDYPCRGRKHAHLVVLRDGSVWFREAGDEVSFIPVVGEAQLSNVYVNHASFCTIDGDTFIAVGSGRLRLYDGERLYWAGLEPPTGYPVAVAGAGSSFSGSYLYKITYIYRTDETFRESGTSTAGGIALNSEITVGANDVDITWAAHPNATPPGNGERCTGYRIYRTQDLGALGDREVFLLLAEIDDVTTVTYTDSTDDTELTDLAPTDRPIPPDGASLVSENSDSLFIGSSKFNRMGFEYSESDYPESFPVNNRTKIPDASSSNLTGFFKIAGIFGCMTEDKIYHIAGSSPADFIHREMSNFTGCLSPDSLRAVNNVVIFTGKHGIYAWDGASPRVLSEPIKEEVRGLSFDRYRTTYGSAYTERSHYYLSMPNREGTSRRIWVYDLSSESTSQGDGTEADLSEARATRAWFEYTGMPATSMGEVRAYTDRSSILYWGDDLGNLYQYDQGDTDAGASIAMRYDYVFKAAESRTANPIDRTFVVRKIILHTDRWKGAVQVGLKYLRSHTPGFIYKALNRDQPNDGEVRETEVRFAHNGSSAAVVSIRHDGPGEFRVLAVSHEWQPKSLRHQVV